MTPIDNLMGHLLTKAARVARSINGEDFDFLRQPVLFAPWHDPWRVDAAEFMKDTIQEQVAGTPGRTFRGVHNERLRVAAEDPMSEPLEVFSQDSLSYEFDRSTGLYKVMRTRHLFVARTLERSLGRQPEPMTGVISASPWIVSHWDEGFGRTGRGSTFQAVITATMYTGWRLP